MSINQNKSLDHRFFMKLALNQATKNLGNTKDNPSVGCVITKNNSLISVGSTSVNGRPHAEFNAIKSSRSILKGSNLYVTLEPCSHYGKTPPCINKIIKSKIKNVFFSIKDPDLRSYDKSSKKLKRNNIGVYKGINSNEIKHFYRSYFKSKKKGLPFVTCKLATSKDFYIVNKRKRNITNHFSRSRVHLMRSTHDCIMTSSRTIINDNSRLTCRIEGLVDTSPVRILLDNNLKISIKSIVIREAKYFPTIIFYNFANNRKIKILKNSGIKLYKIPLDKNLNLDLTSSLIKAKKLGFNRIFLECGYKLTVNFLKNNLVDDFKLFLSNEKLGKNGKFNIKNELKYFLRNKKGINEKINLFGDSLISYKLK